MSTLLIRMRIKPEKEDRFLETIHGIVESMPGNEPETRVYAFWRTKTPHEYFMVESYTSEDALKFHISRHIDGQEEFQTLLSEPPEVEELGDFVTGFPGVGTLPLATAASTSNDAK